MSSSVDCLVMLCNGLQPMCGICCSPGADADKNDSQRKAKNLEGGKQQPGNAVPIVPVRVDPIAPLRAPAPLPRAQPSAGTIAV